MAQVANPRGMNGPRPKATRGRNRLSVANLASKQDKIKAPKSVSQGLPTHPRASVPEREAKSTTTPTPPSAPITPSGGGSNQFGQSTTAIMAAANQAAMTRLIQTLSSNRGKGGAQTGDGMPGVPNTGGYAITNADKKFMKAIGSGYHANPAQAERMFEIMAARRGFSDKHINMAKAIIEGGRGVDIPESSWRWDADNPNSTAIGIPQRLQSAHGYVSNRWRNNVKPQLKWYMNYLLTHQYPTGTGVRHAYNWKKTHDWY